MRRTNVSRPQLCSALLAVATFGLCSLGLPLRSALADTVVYDQMTGVPSTTWFYVPVAATTAPANTGNEFMGVPANLATSTNLSITGFDICWMNSTGSTITLDAAGTSLLRLRYWIWNRVGNAADAPRAYGPYTAAPGTPAGSGSVVFGNVAYTLNNNFFAAFTGGTVSAATLGAPGTAPAIPITPVTVSSAGPIGFTFNWQLSADSGATWNSVPNMTFIVTGQAGAPPAATGTNAFATPNNGFFASPATEDQDGTGSFLSTSGYNIGVNSGVTFRVYVAGTVASGACCNAASGACTASTSGAGGCPAGTVFGGNGTTCALNCASHACCSATTGYCALAGTNACPAGTVAQATGTTCTPNTCASPSNDDCSAAFALALNVPYVGDNSNATPDGGTDGPGGSCYFGGPNNFNKSVWFTFTAPATTSYEISMCGTVFDSVLAIYSGPDCNTLTEVACDDDSCAAGATFPGPGPGDEFSSDIASVSLTAGTTYRISAAAWNINGTGGAFGIIASYVNAAGIGSCCATSTCTLADAASCTGTFALGGSCSPNPCAPAGVCCRGATCTTTITTSSACSATIPGGTFAGAAFPTGAACNASPTSSAPCCYANYNKANGINVQDIFDFLGDWFAGSPYARTGSNGAPGVLAVQNIFDFLTDWFNGGCS